jgi:hypothetical protein
VITCQITSVNVPNYTCLHTNVQALKCQITYVIMPNYVCLHYQITSVCIPNYASSHATFNSKQRKLTSSLKVRQVPSTNFGLAVGCPQSLQVTLQPVTITYFLLMSSHLNATQSKQHATLYGTTYTAQTARSTKPTSTTLTEQQTISESFLTDMPHVEYFESFKQQHASFVTAQTLNSPISTWKSKEFT